MLDLRKYVEVFDGVKFVVNHNLGTYDIIVNVVDDETQNWIMRYTAQVINLNTVVIQLGYLHVEDNVVEWVEGNPGRYKVSVLA